MKNKKTKVAIIGIIALVLVTIGITYAYWLITRTQTGENVITTGCLDISLNGSGDITLSNQFPMSDEDGMKLTPYTFTVTNNCNTSVDYQVALEAIGDESTAIASSALKVALNDNAGLYSSYAEVDATVSGAYEARRLGFSRLTAKGSEGATDSYSLRIWIDKDADISEMNKTFASKISVTIGQGIGSLYEEGTLAYSILSNYGGTEGKQTLSSEWVEGEYDAETYLAMTKSTSYYWGTEMDFNETNGKYKLGGTIVQATTDECRNGQKNDGTAITCSYTLKNSWDEEYELDIGYKVTALTSSTKTDTSSTLYITAQKKKTASNSFSRGTTASDAGIYKAMDDLGDSYYFRGAPTSNYVEFGTYAESIPDKYYVYVDGFGLTAGPLNSLEECEAHEEVTEWGGECIKRAGVKAGSPMYWRIVRINGDGTIRLVYDGTEKVANGEVHMTTIVPTAYNTNYDDIKYIGYTYDVDGSQKDSAVKDVVDAWYEANLKTNYEKYISDSIFCNDRSGATRDEDNGLYYYASYERVYNKKDPALTCTNKADRYTKDDTTNGNGYLSNPVGLLTADEVMLAGGVSHKSNQTYYLYSGENYWTLSPLYFRDEEPNLNVSIVEDDGSLRGDEVDATLVEASARPVINLKADLEFTGDGTIDAPYEIIME